MKMDEQKVKVAHGDGIDALEVARGLVRWTAALDGVDLSEGREHLREVRERRRLSVPVVPAPRAP